MRTDLNRLIQIIVDGGYRGYLPIETLSLPHRPYHPKELVPKFLAEVRAALAENNPRELTDSAHVHHSWRRT